MEPLPDNTKLALNEAGLEHLRAIPGSVAPVVVIGPYRSGKSFLLNQLMNVSCGELQALAVMGTSTIVMN